MQEPLQRVMQHRAITKLRLQAALHARAATHRIDRHHRDRAMRFARHLHRRGRRGGPTGHWHTRQRRHATNREAFQRLTQRHLIAVSLGAPTFGRIDHPRACATILVEGRFQRRTLATKHGIHQHRAATAIGFAHQSTRTQRDALGVQPVPRTERVRLQCPGTIQRMARRMRHTVHERKVHAHQRHRVAAQMTQQQMHRKRGVAVLRIARHGKHARRQHWIVRRLAPCNHRCTAGDRGFGIHAARRLACHHHIRSHAQTLQRPHGIHGGHHQTALRQRTFRQQCAVAGQTGACRHQHAKTPLRHIVPRAAHVARDQGLPQRGASGSA